MQKDSVELLRRLIETPSPSGNEMRIQELVRQRMHKYCTDVTTDVHGNVIGVMNPRGARRVLLMGHCDEIGFMIVHIDDNGFASFAQVGGVDPGIATGQRVLVQGARGPVFGVIGKKPIHLMTHEEMQKQPKMHELWIDIGAKNRKDAEKSVAIGDYVTVDVGFRQMPNDLVAGRGFDDRAGAFVVLETLRRLKGKKLDVAVYGVASVQEEIGLRGARTSAFGIDPDVGIAVDVGLATDFPSNELRQTGLCALNKGPALHRGPNINPVVEEMLKAAARRRKIPFQITAEPRGTPTDANAIQITRAGVAAGLISVPARYIHTPVEVISLRDLEDASRLLAEFVLSVRERTSFVPQTQKPRKK